MLDSHPLEPLICEAVTLFWEQGDLENTTFSCNHSWAPGQQGINSNPKHFISFSTFWRVFLGRVQCGCAAVVASWESRLVVFLWRRTNPCSPLKEKQLKHS